MTWYATKEEALEALHDFFEKPLTIYDIIAMDRTPKQTQALCAAVLGQPYPKGIGFAFLRRAVTSILKDAEPRDRARSSVILAQAEAKAQAKLRKAHAEAQKIVGHAEGFCREAQGNARKRGKQDAALLVQTAKAQCRVYGENIDSAIRQLNARIREAEAAGVKTGLAEACEIFAGNPVWL